MLDFAYKALHNTKNKEFAYKALNNKETLAYIPYLFKSVSIIRALYANMGPGMNVLGQNIVSGNFLGTLRGAVPE